MKLLDKTVLIISPESLDAHFVSKHHYAITLASQGYSVYFLNPPTTTELKVEKSKYHNLKIVSYYKIVKGLRFYPKVVRVYLQKKWLYKLEKMINIKFDIIWLFENSRFYDMEFASDRLKIYHQVDLNQNFHPKEASLSADICFGTTDYIVDEIKKYNKRAYKIHHGVSLNSYTKSLSKEQEDRFNHKDINVVYIGNLDISFLDIDILKSLVNRHRDITFHLVGSYSKDKKSFTILGEFDNIIWWGRVESNLIPSILAKSDIAILIYRANSEYEKNQLASPHKIMEYLASGKVVVSTYTDDYKDKRELLEMVDNSNDYIKKFDEVVNNLEFYNSKERTNMRIKFAKEHSYKKQLEKIEYLIKGKW